MKTAEEFWACVKKTEEDSCWEWQRATNAQGYGWLWWVDYNRLAHRVVWELTQGSIPDGLFVLHTCDNPPCVNPKHLWLGTKRANAQDRERKGRGHDRRGISNGRAKLTEAMVLQARILWEEGCSLPELSEWFQTPKTTMHHAVSGYTWSHL